MDMESVIFEMARSLGDVINVNESITANLQSDDLPRIVAGLYGLAVWSVLDERAITSDSHHSKPIRTTIDRSVLITVITPLATIIDAAYPNSGISDVIGMLE